MRTRVADSVFVPGLIAAVIGVVLLCEGSWLMGTSLVGLGGLTVAWAVRELGAAPLPPQGGFTIRRLPPGDDTTPNH